MTQIDRVFESIKENSTTAVTVAALASVIAFASIPAQGQITKDGGRPLLVSAVSSSDPASAYADQLLKEINLQIEQLSDDSTQGLDPKLLQLAGQAIDSMNARSDEDVQAWATGLIGSMLS